MIRRLAIGVVALAGVLALTATSPEPDPDEAQFDVEEVGCWVDPVSGTPVAVVRVDNDNGETVAYEIAVHFDTANVELGTVTLEPRIPSGQVRVLEAEGRVPTTTDAGVSCDVIEVRRSREGEDEPDR